MANPEAVVIPGVGNLFVAPVGTGLPVDIDEALAGAFVNVGFLHEGGATFSDGKAPGSAIYSWQRRAPVRRTVGNAEPYLELQLREWDENTFPIAFGGGSVSATANGHIFVPPTTGETVQREIVLAMSDGSRLFRLTAGAAEVHTALQLPLNKMDNAALAVRFEFVTPSDDSAPFDFLTNAAQFGS
ncbi:MAG: hypothetical protein AAGA99_21085 [Actinomycetota bacterium]